MTAALFLFTGCKTAANDQKTVAPINNGLVVTVLDVGQGDAILIQSGGKTALIDAGIIAAGKELVKDLRGLEVKKIDHLFATHPHIDHIGGMKSILNTFKIGAAYDNNYTETDSKTYKYFLQTIADKHIKHKVLRAGDEIEVGSAKLKVLWPTDKFIKDTPDDVNANGLVMMLTYGEFRMLLAGDANMGTEEAMLKLYTKRDLRADVLKVAHHTSKTSSTQKWLSYVKPKDAIASYAKENKYGFPTKPTLNRIKNIGANYYNTADGGNVIVISDGKTYQIVTEK